MKIKNILITGATGRIASALRESLSGSSYNVFPVSREKVPGFYAYSDVLTTDLLAKIDVVLHLAWSSVPITSENNFGKEWATDLPLLQKLLQKVKTLKPKDLHFIFFSSAGAIYSNIEGEKATEKTPCCPANLYGWSKMHAEQLLQQFSLRFSMPLTILRVSNVYGGKFRLNDQQGIIPLLARAALDSKEMTIWGDGTAQKDYIHINDLSSLVELIICRQTTGLFNVCFGESHSLLKIIELIEKHSRCKILTHHTSGYRWDNQHVAIDNDKIKAQLDWQPEIAIEHGIQLILDSIKSD